MTFEAFLFLSVIAVAFVVMWCHLGDLDCVTKLIVISAFLSAFLYCAWGIFGSVVVLLGLFCGMADSDWLIPLGLCITVVIVVAALVYVWRNY